MRIYLDSGVAITAAQTRIPSPGLYVIDTLCENYDVCFPREVKVEVVDNGLPGGYPDAVRLNAKVNAGQITVEQAPAVHSQYERIIRGYTGLGSGDIAILKVALQNRRNKRQVVSLSDDYLVLLIAHRLNLKVMMLPDFVEVMYKQQVITKTVAREMLYEMSPRYGSGIINHSLSKI